MTLEGKTLFISGGSRGIGLAIAIRAARDGANIALIAKTAEPHPKLEGTVYTAAAQIEAAGGRALPVVGDIRYEAQVDRAVERLDRAAPRSRVLQACARPPGDRAVLPDLLGAGAGHEPSGHVLGRPRRRRGRSRSRGIPAWATGDAPGSQEKHRSSGRRK